LKKYTFKIKVVPIKLFEEEGVLSEQEFEQVKRTRIYKGMKVLEVKDLGYDSFWRNIHYYELIVISEGEGLFDCYYDDVIIVEKLKEVEGIIIKEKDPEPVKVMKKLVASWYQKKLVDEEKAYDVCKKFIM